MAKEIREIDGDQFDDLSGFYREVIEHVLQGSAMGKNLDAFNDVLRGGFRTPSEGFVLKWKNSDRSREVLGYEETARQREAMLKVCHKSSRKKVKDRIRQAKLGQGPTLFDEIVEIIRDHGPGGDQEGDGVDLELA